MDWLALIESIGGGLPAAVIVALAWSNYRKDQQLVSKDDRYIDLALSTQKALGELTAAIRELRK